MNVYKRGLTSSVKTATPYYLYHTAETKALSLYNRGVKVGSSGLAGTGVFADVKDEVNKTDSEVEAMHKELWSAIPAPQEPNKYTVANTFSPWELTDWTIEQRSDPKLQFVINVWAQFYRDWQDFKKKHEHWYHNMFLSAWHGVADFRQRLLAMYQASKLLGFDLKLPEPQPIPPDAIAALGSDIKGTFTSIWDMARLLVYVAIGLLGGWVLLQAWKEFKPRH